MIKKAIPLDIYPNFQQRLKGKSFLQRVALKAFPVIPRHAYHPFLSEVRAALGRVVNRPGRVRNAYKDRRDLQVNIGCGPCGKGGWVNLDFFRSPGVNCLYDCRKDLPFSDNSVRCIFTEHFFEHLSYVEEVPLFLSECCRVLEPGGWIRVIVPDAEKYIRAYCADGWDDLARIHPLYPDHTDGFGSGFNTKMEVVNSVFRQYFEHKWAYDFATLQFLLARYGFCEIQQQEFGRSALPTLCIDNPERASGSLYVEGRKVGVSDDPQRPPS
jgi:predicted SAM-dependent methyltransferase